MTTYFPIDKDETMAIVAPFRKGEIVQVSRAGDWVTVVLNTHVSINTSTSFKSKLELLAQRLRVAFDILRHGYHDTRKQKVMLVLHHSSAAELNDILIESIYYTEGGDYKGERFTYQDPEPNSDP